MNEVTMKLDPELRKAVTEGFCNTLSRSFIFSVILLTAMFFILCELGNFQGVDDPLTLLLLCALSQFLTAMCAFNSFQHTLRRESRK